MENYTMADVFKGFDMLEEDERLLKWNDDGFYTDDDAPFEIKAVAHYKNKQIESRKRISAELSKARDEYEARRLFGR